MKKFFYFLLLVSIGCCYADIDEKLIFITCLPKMGYLKVYGYDSLEDTDEQELFAHTGDSSTCKINGDTYEVSIEYEPEHLGIGGGDHAGHLDILKNGKEIVDNLTFNNSHSNDVKAVEYNAKTNQLSLTVMPDFDDKFQPFYIKKIGFINDDDVQEALHDRDRPSFDCDKALKILDKVICLSENLSNLDQSLAFHFNWLTDYLSPAERKALLDEQRLWLKNRSKTCELADKNASNSIKVSMKSLDCLQNIYTARIEELASRKKTFLKKQASAAKISIIPDM